MANEAPESQVTQPERRPGPPPVEQQEWQRREAAAARPPEVVRAPEGNERTKPTPAQSFSAVFDSLDKAEVILERFGLNQSAREKYQEAIDATKNIDLLALNRREQQIKTKDMKEAGNDPQKRQKLLQELEDLKTLRIMGTRGEGVIRANWGLAALRFGNEDEAQQQFAQAFKLDPNQAKDPDFITHVQDATAANQLVHKQRGDQGRFPDALAQMGLQPGAVEQPGVAPERQPGAMTDQQQRELQIKEAAKARIEAIKNKARQDIQGVIDEENAQLQAAGLPPVQPGRRPPAEAGPPNQTPERRPPAETHGPTEPAAPTAADMDPKLKLAVDEFGKLSDKAKAELAPMLENTEHPEQTLTPAQAANVIAKKVLDGRPLDADTLAEFKVLSMFADAVKAPAIPKQVTDLAASVNAQMAKLTGQDLLAPNDDALTAKVTAAGADKFGGKNPADVLDAELQKLATLKGDDVGKERDAFAATLYPGDQPDAVANRKAITDLLAQRSQIEAQMDQLPLSQNSNALVDLVGKASPDKLSNHTAEQVVQKVLTMLPSQPGDNRDNAIKGFAESLFADKPSQDAMIKLLHDRDGIMGKDLIKQQADLKGAAQKLWLLSSQPSLTRLALAEAMKAAADKAPDDATKQQLLEQSKQQLADAAVRAGNSQETISAMTPLMRELKLNDDDLTKAQARLKAATEAPLAAAPVPVPVTRAPEPVAPPALRKGPPPVEQTNTQGPPQAAPEPVRVVPPADPPKDVKTVPVVAPPVETRERQAPPPEAAAVTANLGPDVTDLIKQIQPAVAASSAFKKTVNETLDAAGENASPDKLKHAFADPLQEGGKSRKQVMEEAMTSFNDAYNKLIMPLQAQMGQFETEYRKVVPTTLDEPLKKFNDATDQLRALSKNFTQQDSTIIQAMKQVVWNAPADQDQSIDISKLNFTAEQKAWLADKDHPEHQQYFDKFWERNNIVSESKLSDEVLKANDQYRDLRDVVRQTTSMRADMALRYTQLLAASGQTPDDFAAARKALEQATQGLPDSEVQRIKGSEFYKKISDGIAALEAQGQPHPKAEGTDSGAIKITGLSDTQLTTLTTAQTDATGAFDAVKKANAEIIKAAGPDRKNSEAVLQAFTGKDKTGATVGPGQRDSMQAALDKLSEVYLKVAPIRKQILDERLAAFDKEIKANGLKTTPDQIAASLQGYYDLTDKLNETSKVSGMTEADSAMFQKIVSVDRSNKDITKKNEGVADDKKTPVAEYTAEQKSWIDAHKTFFQQYQDSEKYKADHQITDGMLDFDDAWTSAYTKSLHAIDQIAGDRINTADILARLLAGTGDQASALKVLNSAMTGFDDAQIADAKSIPDVAKLFQSLQKSPDSEPSSDRFMKPEIKTSGDAKVDELAKTKSIQWLDDKVASLLGPAQKDIVDHAGETDPDKARQRQETLDARWQDAKPYLQAAILRAESQDADAIKARVAEIQKKLEDKSTSDVDRVSLYQESTNLLGRLIMPIELHRQMAVDLFATRQIVDGKTTNQYVDSGNEWLAAAKLAGSPDLPADLLTKQRELINRDIADPDINKRDDGRDQRVTAALRQIDEGQVERLRDLPLQVTETAAKYFVAGALFKKDEKSDFSRPAFPPNSRGAIDTGIIQPRVAFDMIQQALKLKQSLYGIDINEGGDKEKALKLHENDPDFVTLRQLAEVVRQNGDDELKGQIAALDAKSWKPLAISATSAGVGTLVLTGVMLLAASRFKALGEADSVLSKVARLGLKEGNLKGAWTLGLGLDLTAATSVDKAFHAGDSEYTWTDAAEHGGAYALITAAAVPLLASRGLARAYKNIDGAAAGRIYDSTISRVLTGTDKLADDITLPQRQLFFGGLRGIAARAGRFNPQVATQIREFDSALTAARNELAPHQGTMRWLGDRLPLAKDPATGDIMLRGTPGRPGLLDLAEKGTTADLESTLKQLGSDPKNAARLKALNDAINRVEWIMKPHANTIEMLGDRLPGNLSLSRFVKIKDGMAKQETAGMRDLLDRPDLTDHSTGLVRPIKVRSLLEGNEAFVKEISSALGTVAKPETTTLAQAVEQLQKAGQSSDRLNALATSAQKDLPLRGTFQPGAMDVLEHTNAPEFQQLMDTFQKHPEIPSTDTFAEAFSKLPEAERQSFGSFAEAITNNEPSIKPFLDMPLRGTKTEGFLDILDNTHAGPDPALVQAVNNSFARDTRLNLFSAQTRNASFVSHFESWAQGVGAGPGRAARWVDDITPDTPLASRMAKSVVGVGVRMDSGLRTGGRAFANWATNSTGDANALGLVARAPFRAAIDINSWAQPTRDASLIGRGARLGTKFALWFPKAVYTLPSGVMSGSTPFVRGMIAPLIPLSADVAPSVATRLGTAWVAGSVPMTLGQAAIQYGEYDSEARHHKGTFQTPWQQLSDDFSTILARRPEPGESKWESLLLSLNENKMMFGMNPKNPLSSWSPGWQIFLVNARIAPGLPGAVDSIGGILKNMGTSLYQRLAPAEASTNWQSAKQNLFYGTTLELPQLGIAGWLFRGSDFTNRMGVPIRPDLGLGLIPGNTYVNIPESPITMFNDQRARVRRSEKWFNSSAPAERTRPVVAPVAPVEQTPANNAPEVVPAPAKVEPIPQKIEAAPPPVQTAPPVDTAAPVRKEGEGQPTEPVAPERREPVVPPPTSQAPTGQTNKPDPKKAKPIVNSDI